MSQAPPGPIALTEQDYQADRDRLAAAVAGTGVVLDGRGCDVDMYTDLHTMLSDADPAVVRRLAATAIVVLVKQQRIRTSTLGRPR